MRARRLRRLGLNGGDITATSSTENSTTITATATNVCKLSDNDAKITITPSKNSICPETEDHDDNQHKQKQQKFDNELKYEVGFNNNIAAFNSDTKTTSNQLAQRSSRLLDEIEKQRIENKLNQNQTKETIINDVTITTTDAIQPNKTDVEMEMVDNQHKAGSDSGIENMEVEELTPSMEQTLTTTKPMNVEQMITDESKELEAEICLSRMLDASWFDHCEGQIFVSDTAENYKDEKNDVDFEDLAFQIITEIIVQYFDGKRIDFKATTSNSSVSTSSSVTSMVTNETERMDTSEANCSTPNLMPHNLPHHGALIYLIQSYIRSCNEQERYNSSKNQQKFGSIVSDVIAMVKKQLITAAKLLLNGTVATNQSPMASTESQAYRSVLLKLLYEDAVPSDFLCFLIEESYQDAKIFDNIFGVLVQNLYVDMQSRVIGKNIDMAPINVLKQLLEITINGSTRPICNLIINLPNFSPTLCTESHGREIVKASYLGPFLSLSVFSEENPKLAEDVDDNWEATFGNGLRMVCDLFVY